MALKDSEAEEGGEDMVSSAEFFEILEDVMQTMLTFLMADKKSPCQMLQSLVRRKSTSADPEFLHLLKRANKKVSVTSFFTISHSSVHSLTFKNSQKKKRLKELLKESRYLRKEWLKGDGEIVLLMALIDMKIVSRILRMDDVSQEQLHWCDKKMARVRVWDGNVQRDTSPLLNFPVH